MLYFLLGSTKATANRNSCFFNVLKLLRRLPDSLNQGLYLYNRKPYQAYTYIVAHLIKKVNTFYAYFGDSSKIFRQNRGRFYDVISGFVVVIANFNDMSAKSVCYNSYKWR